MRKISAWMLLLMGLILTGCHAGNPDAGAPVGNGQNGAPSQTASQVVQKANLNPSRKTEVVGKDTHKDDAKSGDDGDSQGGDGNGAPGESGSSGGVIIVNGNVVGNGDTTKGDGHVVQEERKLAHFDQIRVDCACDVHVNVGESQRVEIETDQNLLPHLRTEVTGSRLRIYAGHNIAPTHTIRITISVPGLKQLTLNGSSDMVVQNLHEKQFAVDISGSGDVRLSGAADTLDLDLSGSGSMDARDLNAATVKVDISGSGDTHVHATRELDADISGSGSIRYSGHPAKVTRDVSGSGSITEE